MPHFLTRFAPSPTGYLHLGHAASALAVWKAASEADGTVLLRIEDIDQTRCRPHYEAAIFDDLAWLGLEWSQSVRRQSDHFSDYQQILDELASRGLIYRCFRTRKEVLSEIDRAPHGHPNAFIGTPLPSDEEAARLAQGQAFAWRLSLARARDMLGTAYNELSYRDTGRPVQARPDLFGDVVLARKDTPTSYHLSATHDDALQGVTHIIRGEDLAMSTSVHVLLQTLMGWPTPDYSHHGLLLGADGKRFAKRDKSRTLRTMRAAGLTPEDVKRLVSAA